MTSCPPPSRLRDRASPELSSHLQPVGLHQPLQVGRLHGHAPRQVVQGGALRQEGVRRDRGEPVYYPSAPWCRGVEGHYSCLWGTGVGGCPVPQYGETTPSSAGEGAGCREGSWLDMPNVLRVSLAVAILGVSQYLKNASSLSSLLPHISELEKETSEYISVSIARRVCTVWTVCTRPGLKYVVQFYAGKIV